MHGGIELSLAGGRHHIDFRALTGGKCVTIYGQTEVTNDLIGARLVADELIYAHHERGFALFSMRSTTRSRLYIQCTPDEHLDEWPDERI